MTNNKSECKCDDGKAMVKEHHYTCKYHDCGYPLDEHGCKKCAGKEFLPQNTEKDRPAYKADEEWVESAKSVGDSLRKQEEKCCAECYRNPTGRVFYCGNKSCPCHSTPKVATSEKECDHENKIEHWEKGKRQDDICKDCNTFFTPHESEDWEAEFDALLLELQGQSGFSSYIGSFHCAKIKDFIRKIYQRGREEALSLAVQEIEKGKTVELSVDEDSEKQSWANAGYYKGFNQGLDKAIEIISGLKSKE